jgi:hypothetical protein
MKSRCKLTLTLFLLSGLTALAAAQQSQTSSGGQNASTPATTASPQTADGTQDSATAQDSTAAGQKDTAAAPAQGGSSGKSPAAQTPSTKAGDSPAATPAASSPDAKAQNADSDAAAKSGDASTTGSTAAADNTTPEPENPKVKAGSTKDVDAIGNRKVGKRSAGQWYSYESEIKLGREYAQMVESSSKMVTDPVVTEYVNRIGQNLVRNSDAKVPFTIKVIDSDEINAFALPGGFFYVNSGLILAADEEAELAGVMAHEIAHVACRHAMKEITRQQWAQIGMLPLVIFGGTAGYIAYETSGLTIPMAFMKFSRTFESQADYFGVQYMYKAGYDPQAYVAFFEKIQAKEKKKPGTVAKVFMDHPPTPDRIEATQKEIATILPARESYTVSTSEFAEVKARLAALENKRLVQGGKDNKKPSLRRKNNDDDTNSTSNGDDNRPTLKRRD